MSLDTLANVKLRLGVTISDDDSLISALMDSADQYIAEYCGRDFDGGTFTEYHAGDTSVVFLRNFPVDSVTSVKVDPAYGFGAETLRPATAYVVLPDRGVIQSLTGPFLPQWAGLPIFGIPAWMRAPRVVQVVYSTATDAVPADVREAYALLIGHWYRYVKTQIASGFQNVYRQTAGSTTVIFARDQIAGGTLPPDLSLLLGAYRVPRL
jgi:Phage gp6-like head-tail connector protein